MSLCVGIAFKPVGPIGWYASGEAEYLPGDAVIVETENGSELGFVKLGTRALPEADLPSPLRHVLRHASPEDWANRERGERRRADAMRVCREKVARLELPMKLLECEWTLDGSQVTFHFLAEGRIDFRELVRQTSSALHARVLMHQIGARDETKVFPGIGPCGRPTCCSTFLREFVPVSIKMVKDQSMALNPSKYTGLCGKLMCCLRYEQDEGPSDRPKLPQSGMVVMTPMGRAKVEEADALREIVTVQLENGRYVEVRLKDIGEVPNCVDHSEGDCAGCAIAAAIKK